MNPFPGKFTPHSSMNDSCIIQQFSSDYSLRENSLLTSVQVEKEENSVHHHSELTDEMLNVVPWMAGVFTQ